MIFASMLILGALIGFVGAGGAGVTITLLVVGFGVPIHTALAVALASMVFTMLSGALLGAATSNIMPASDLSFMTALMILSSAVILYTKLYHAEWLAAHFPVRKTLLTGRKLWIYGILTGLICGFLAGAFGIGAAAYIQLALMVIFGVPLLKAIGTCMMIILPISAAGGLGYLASGHLDLSIFLQTLSGLMIGAWFGAQGTHLAPLPVLKFAIVTMPSIGGVIMMIGR